MKRFLPPPKFSPRFRLCSFLALGALATGAFAGNLRVTPGENTLLEARDAARAARRGAPDAPVTVWLSAGDYFLSAPLVLGPEDSGTTYRAAEGATVRLIGARRIAAADFKGVTDDATLARIPAAARGRIVALDLPALGLKHADKLPDLFTDGGGLVDLFIGGRRLPLARYPNGTGTLTMRRVLDNAGGPKDANWRAPTAVPKLPPGAPGGVFEFREEFAAAHGRWSRVLDRGVWLKGYWRVAWQNEAVRVGAIDTVAHTVTLAKPVPGGIGNKYSRPKGSGREAYWLINLLEECDQPGEWCVDFVDRKLYLFPPASLEGAEVLLADSGEPVVRIAGASQLTLRGLIVEGSLGHGIEVKGGEGVLVAGCTVRNVDRYGVVLDGGKNNTVLSCDLYNLGAGGVWLGGGDEKSTPRVAAGHRAVNNHIYHFGQIERVYAPGINCGFTGGGGGGHHVAVGMLVAHNLIHDTPHASVLFGSWDSTFEFNEVFRYCTVSNDAGAFYSYDIYGRFGGHTLRHNFMHSSDDGDGIYFDHDHPGMTVFGNIAFLQSRGGKRGTSFLYKSGTQAKNPQSIDCRNNVAVQSTLGFAFVSAEPGAGRIENNVVVACKAPSTWREIKDGKETPVAAGYASGTNAVYASAIEAGFGDLTRHDFHLRPDAKLFRDLPGFTPIPFDQIGLYRDEYRPTLPTGEAVGRFTPITAANDAGLHYDILDRK